MAISICFTCFEWILFHRFTAPQGFAADQDQCLPQPTFETKQLSPLNCRKQQQQQQQQPGNNPFHEEKEVMFQRCFQPSPVVPSTLEVTGGSANSGHGHSSTWFRSYVIHGRDSATLPTLATKSVRTTAASISYSKASWLKKSPSYEAPSS